MGIVNLKVAPRPVSDSNPNASTVAFNFIDLLSRGSKILASDQEMPHGGTDKGAGIAETTGLNLQFDEAFCFLVKVNAHLGSSLSPYSQGESVRRVAPGITPTFYFSNSLIPQV